MLDERTYPLSFSIEYPVRQLNRLSTATRPLLAIPIVLLAWLLMGVEPASEYRSVLFSAADALAGVGAIWAPVLLMLLVRQKYPRWWFEWNLELLRFINRIAVYLMLVTDAYPSTDERQSVRLSVPYPARGTLSRGLPLIKWLLAVPHYVALVPLLISLPFVGLAAWLSILATGRYPRPLYSYVEGVLRWWNRVVGYSLILVTDEYPPFRLAE